MKVVMRAQLKAQRAWLAVLSVLFPYSIPPAALACVMRIRALQARLRS